MPRQAFPDDVRALVRRPCQIGIDEGGFASHGLRNGIDLLRLDWWNRRFLRSQRVVHLALDPALIERATHMCQQDMQSVGLLHHLPPADRKHVQEVMEERPYSSWQVKADQGYDLTHFTIDWEAHQVLCPQGKRNTCWMPHRDAWGTPVISVKFSRTDCRLYPVRALCTKAAESPRHVTLRIQTDHQILQQARRLQTAPEWKKRYERRAGIEGTISQGTRGFGLRRSRYIGEAKTHLQHIFTASAINLVRFAAWKAGTRQAKTCVSRFAALKAS